MTAFVPGDFLPSFTADSSVNPQFGFGTVAGRQLLLVFVGSTQTEQGRSLAEAVVAEAECLREQRVLVYLVTVDPRDRDSAPLCALPDRYVAFWDFDRSIHRRYGMLSGEPDILRIGAFVIRENLRLQAYVAADPPDSWRTRMREAVLAMPRRQPPRRAQPHAPVLFVPDVIDRDQCRRLIDYYEATGGNESGFMRDVGGQTRGLIDSAMKRRKDCGIQDPALRDFVFRALRDRVAPEIHKAFGFRATRVERYIIGCYDEGDHGFFRAHRDNTSKATAHRAFAVSLNLNSEDYEGGHLMFPEYGPALYKPETGAAVVFSCSLLHEATPVVRGRRYVVLPFLYDERGAAVRAANRKFLADPPELAATQAVAAEGAHAA